MCLSTDSVPSDRELISPHLILAGEFPPRLQTPPELKNLQTVNRGKQVPEALASSSVWHGG